jgi:polyhydroxybutyrate depolymerase
MSRSRHATTLAAIFALSCAPDRAQPYAPPVMYAPPPAYGPTPAPPPSPSPISPGCGKAARPGALAAQHVNVAGRDRAYLLVIPDAYAPQTPYPVVFVLHGGGGNAQGARTQTDLERASAGRAIFVYPDAVSGNWDLDSPAASNADVALFDALLLTTHNTLCTDPRRVFVTGFSNGAYMANQLACRRGERIRAIVTHAGGGPYETKGTYDAEGRLVCPGKAVASLVVHGSADRTVAPSEGQKSIDHWTRANRCGSSTSPAWSPPCVAFQSCFQPVGTCQIPGLGHGLWKDAGRATWAFFDSFR